MLLLKFILTTTICLTAFIASCQQPLAITENVLLNGDWVKITRKSSTNINQTAVMEFVGDCEKNVHKYQRLSLKPVLNGVISNRVVEFYSRCIERGNVDAIAPGNYIFTSIDIEKDEVAVVEILNAANKRVSYEIIDFKHKDVMRSLAIPEQGNIRVTVKKLAYLFKRVQD